MNPELIDRFDKSVANVAMKAAQVELEIDSYITGLAGRFQRDFGITPEAAVANATGYVEWLVNKGMALYFEKTGNPSEPPARGDLVAFCKSAEPVMLPMLYRHVEMQRMKEGR